jgi:hypothetical protein
VFPPTEWHLVIDDGRTDAQDLAVAVCKPWIKTSQTLNSLPTFYSIDFVWGSLRYFCVDGRFETSRLLMTPQQYENRPSVLAQPGIVYDPDT